MNPRHIVIDVRHLHDFGIGTYIRNLVRSLSALDHENRYTLITPPARRESSPAWARTSDFATTRCGIRPRSATSLFRYFCGISRRDYSIFR